MKKNLIIVLFISTLFLSGCSNQEKERIADLENVIKNLNNVIDDCNDSISDAKSYIGESYEDMEYALDSLEECYY